MGWHQVSQLWILWIASFTYKLALVFLFIRIRYLFLTIVFLINLSLITKLKLEVKRNNRNAILITKHNYNITLNYILDNLIIGLQILPELTWLSFFLGIILNCRFVKVCCKLISIFRACDYFSYPNILCE